MSTYVGNTMVKTADVISTYRTVVEHSIKEVLSGEDNVTEDVILCSDFYRIISNIEHDIYNIKRLIKNYELSEAIGELDILAERLY